MNRIVTENEKVGVPKTIWDAPASTLIEGFSADISYDIGETVEFKINVNGAAAAQLPYRIEIYRLGYYGGAGATLVTSLTNVDGTVQPDPIRDNRGVVDAGNWSVTDSWQIPADGVSGVYLAKLQRLDGAGGVIDGATNQIPFIVRDDTPDDGTKSDIVLQTSDTTWHAYNAWSGNNGVVGGNFYGGFDQPDGLTNDPGLGAYDRAFAVSYNRPFITRNAGPAAGPQDYLFGADYAAIFWLEKNGYDVSYISGVDTDRGGVAGLLGHKAYISVGHDEYWSGPQRANVEAARDGGVNLLFWSGNEVYWRTRYEGSIDGSGTDYRTLVSYKETWANGSLNAGAAQYANIDPSSEWTGTWRDLRFVSAVDANGNPTAVGQEPENSLTGQLFGPDGTGEFGGALDIPQAFAELRLWRDTGVATAGTLDIAPGIIGYEWNVSPEDEYRPAGLIKLSSTTLPWSGILTDQGNRTAPGVATHNLSLYRDAESGALVFGAGTVFWTWGLSDQHDSSPYGANIENTVLQQFTVNMFADMGIQPGVSDAFLTSVGLARASASTDTIAATTTLDDLPDDIAAFQTITISGTATDDDGDAAVADGRVAAVEVSLDGGATWRVAQGTTDWTYQWRPTAEGSYAIRARAIDDSLNVANVVSASGIVQVSAPVAPDTFSLFDPSVPIDPSFNSEAGAAPGLELGVKFTTAQAGAITQLRYFRAAADAGDTDVREGRLWGPDGTLLATVTFTSLPNEGSWQFATLATPVAVLANTQYVVSYRTNNNYVATQGFFSPALEAAYDGVDNDAFSGEFGGVSAPQSVASSGNGVFNYGAAIVLPTSSFNDSNYWVDVTFDPADPTGNAPPSFTSGNFTVTEGQAAAGVVTATDPNGNALTYAIAGGADAGSFVVDATTGVLSFTIAPNFEAPLDAGADNVYDLNLSVSDGLSTPVVQAISVTVTDAIEAVALGFDGATLQAQYLFDNAAPFDPPAVLGDTRSEVARNGGGPEIVALAEQAGNPDAVGNSGLGLVDIDFEGNSIRYFFPIASGLPQPLGFVPHVFNGPSIIDAVDGLRPILGATLVGQSGFSGSDGITQNDIVFTENSVYLYVGGTQRVDGATILVDVTFANAIPVITSGTGETAAIVIDENTVAVAQITASDADAVDTATFGIVGGEDAALFTIDPATGALTFLAAPDFELPASGSIPDYQVEVQVIDAYGGTDTQLVTVTVADVFENSQPVITSDGGSENAAVMVAEGSPAVTVVAASDLDPDQTLTYTIAGGADQALFTLDATTGVLAFVAAPDFETPADLGGNNVYDLIVEVADGVGGADTQTIAVLITNLNEAPTDIVFVPLALAEAGVGSSTVTGTLVGTATSKDPDSPESVSYSLLANAGGRFSIDAASGAVRVANAALLDFETSRDHFVTIRVTDLAGAFYDEGFAINLTNVIETQLRTLTTGNDIFVASSDDNWTVNASRGSDSVTTRNGIDTVKGGLGDDLIATGGGNDFIVYDAELNGFDSIDGGAGTDTVRANAANVVIGLRSLTGVEAVAGHAGVATTILRGASGGVVLDFSAAALTNILRIEGGTGSDAITGSASADVIAGGRGNDTLRGGDGDDFFQVTAGAGVDRFDGGIGFDTIVAVSKAVVISVPGSFSCSGNGVEAIVGFSDFSTRFVGSAAADVLDFSNIDLVNIGRIDGANGNDTIIGSIGNDTIYGGNGRDLLTGGSGADIFVYGAVSHSSRSSFDTIVDFVQSEDVIDLSGIDTSTAANDQSFVFIDNNQFSGTGVAELRIDVTSNSDNRTMIYADLNGDRIVDISIQLTGEFQAVPLSQANFVL